MPHVRLRSHAVRPAGRQGHIVRSLTIRGSLSEWNSGKVSSVDRVPRHGRSLKNWLTPARFTEPFKLRAMSGTMWQPVW
jgi:hypothetical protein